ncbi:MAG: ribonuclease HII, partial [Deltaproteobacteria bacterium]|nr:ribonuclease HII [Deltaproteobacteria bacterium]
MSRLPGSSDVFADPEAFWRLKGLSLIAGVDEVGRGPLAGPVVAAAVILPDNCRISGLADSKSLTPEARADLDEQIGAAALALAIRELGARRIESLGILKAALRAMAQAVQALNPIPQLVLVDG